MSEEPEETETTDAPGPTGEGIETEPRGNPETDEVFTNAMPCSVQSWQSRMR